MKLAEGAPFDGYRAAVADSSQYLLAPNPQLVISNGMVEETLEVLGAADPTERELEVGDALYYANAAARLGDLSLEQVTHAGSFREWQQGVAQGATTTALPVFTRVAPAD